MRVVCRHCLQSKGNARCASRLCSVYKGMNKKAEPVVVAQAWLWSWILVRLMMIKDYEWQTGCKIKCNVAVKLSFIGEATVSLKKTRKVGLKFMYWGPDWYRHSLPACPGSGWTIYKAIGLAPGYSRIPGMAILYPRLCQPLLINFVQITPH